MAVESEPLRLLTSPPSLVPRLMSYPTVRQRDITPRLQYLTSWERVRHNAAHVHLFTEMVAELIGVFFYVYAGVGATAAFVVGNLTSQPLGSLYTVGFSYSIGIVLAITVCATASGGHFHPGVTISLVIFRGFPVQKAVLYIFAQILGGFLACLFIYVQWKDLLEVAENVLVARGLYDTLMFTPEGPAGIFALYLLPGTNKHRVLLNEFITDILIGLTICACLDPTNYFIPPPAAPWIIGFAYGMAVWGYSPTATALNSARDVGGRMMAVAIWGPQAAGGSYAALAALTNIPATILAFFIYDTFLGSSSRTLTPQHVAHLRARKLYYDDNGIAPPGYLSALDDTSRPRSFDEKHAGSTNVEVVA